MGAFGTAHLVCLLLAVASVAALCGFIASTVARTNKRRARGFFVVGVFCGLLAGRILRRRRRGLRTLVAIAQRVDSRACVAGMRSSTERFAARALSLAGSHVRPRLPSQWTRLLRAPRSLTR
jgi:hypothetical protein